MELKKMSLYLIFSSILMWLSSSLLDPKIWYLTINIIYFIIPWIYMTRDNPKLMRNTFIFGFIHMGPIMIAIDILAIRDGSWFVPLVLTERILGIIPFEDLVGGVFWSTLTIAGYIKFTGSGNFFSRLSIIKIIVRMLPWIIIEVVLLIAFFIGFIQDNNFYIPYSYLYIGTIMVTLPIILAVYRTNNRSILIKRLLITSMISSTFLLVYNFWGIALDVWNYPGGNFIASTVIYDKKIPIDEILFWIAGSAPACVSIYHLLIEKGETR